MLRRFEVYPEVELTGLRVIEVEKPVVGVTGADGDVMLDTRKQQATQEEKAALLDAEDRRVTIDFTGSVDGEGFRRRQKRPISFWRWARVDMIPGLSGVKGHKSWRRVHYRCDLPEECRAENTEGKRQVRYRQS
ncbi:hypothetical protein KCP75_00830 [Salmonella enterica subsp. enterica]|nr:hypothetical protein KCP75_00830 [Salmonella enterica subsp. enterica]